MKVLIILSALLLCPPAARAAAKKAPAQRDAVSVSTPAAQGQDAQPAAKAPARTAKKAPAKAKQEEEEAGEVMIDSRPGDDAETGTFRAAFRGEEEAPAPNSLPATFGQLKGAVNDGGRNLLVFEGDDGVISFVQVSFGKGGMTWKLIDRLTRNME